MGTPEVAPVAKSEVPVAPVTGCEAVKREIDKYTDWNQSIMFAIAQAENSACDPVNHNLTSSETHYNGKGEVICVGSYGVLQVGCLHYREGENPDDLATNVSVAHRVWAGSGYTAWTMYKNGRYQKFL